MSTEADVWLYNGTLYVRGILISGRVMDSVLN